MPSSHSLWLVTAPADSSPEEQLGDLEEVLGHGKLGNAVGVVFPEFKVRQVGLHGGGNERGQLLGRG